MCPSVGFAGISLEFSDRSNGAVTHFFSIYPPSERAKVREEEEEEEEGKGEEGNRGIAGFDKRGCLLWLSVLTKPVPPPSIRPFCHYLLPPFTFPSFMQGRIIDCAFRHTNPSLPSCRRCARQWPTQPRQRALNIHPSIPIR